MRDHDFAKVEIRQKFYNDPLTEDAWNDFYYWRFHTSPSLDSLDSWDAQVPMNVDPNAGVDVDVGAGYADADDDADADTQVLMEEGREQRFGQDCRYWEGSFQNEAILQSLLQMEDDGASSPQSLSQSSGVANNERKKRKSPTQEYLSFFWDESASNQATIELLMKNEELERQSMSVWEEKEIVFAHQAKSSRSRTETEPAEQVKGLLENQASVQLS